MEIPCHRATFSYPMSKVYLFHGAGAGHNSVFLKEFRTQLISNLASLEEHDVLPFSLQYMVEMDQGGKRRPPPNINRLIEEARLSIDPSEPIILIGKSMGSRIIAELCETHNVKACVALGYPFYPPKKPEKDRLSHLIKAKSVPFLIVQGTRDSLGNQEWVEQQKLPSNVSLHWIEGADHDFKVLKRYNVNDDEVMARIVELATSFIKPYL